MCFAQTPNGSQLDSGLQRHPMVKEGSGSQVWPKYTGQPLSHEPRRLQRKNNTFGMFKQLSSVESKVLGASVRQLQENSDADDYCGSILLLGPVAFQEFKGTLSEIAES